MFSDFYIIIIMIDIHCYVFLKCMLPFGTVWYKIGLNIEIDNDIEYWAKGFGLVRSFRGLSSK